MSMKKRQILIRLDNTHQKLMFRTLKIPLNNESALSKVFKPCPFINKILTSIELKQCIKLFFIKHRKKLTTDNLNLTSNQLQ